jgi:hypothetical protein
MAWRLRLLVSQEGGFPHQAGEVGQLDQGIAEDDFFLPVVGAKDSQPFEIQVLQARVTALGRVAPCQSASPLLGVEEQASQPIGAIAVSTPHVDCHAQGAVWV